MIVGSRSQNVRINEGSNLGDEMLALNPPKIAINRGRPRNTRKEYSDRWMRLRGKSLLLLIDSVLLCHFHCLLDKDLSPPCTPERSAALIPFTPSDRPRWAKRVEKAACRRAFHGVSSSFIFAPNGRHRVDFESSLMHFRSVWCRCCLD